MIEIYELTFEIIYSSSAEYYGDRYGTAVPDGPFLIRHDNSTAQLTKTFQEMDVYVTT